MESPKSKMLRIVNYIYDIVPKKIVFVYVGNDVIMFKCQCINGNYDLYDINDKHNSWGLSGETLDDMREALLKDYVMGLFDDIRDYEIKRSK